MLKNNSCVGSIRQFVAAVLIPLLLSAEISVGIATAILHLIIGLPILALIPAMGQKSLRR